MIVQKVAIKEWHSYVPLLKRKMTECNATCELCGFQSPKYMSLSADRYIKSLDDLEGSFLKLTCPFCSDAYQFNYARSKGYIVALPELSQSELNSIVYAFWAVKASIQMMDRKSLNEGTDNNIAGLEKNLSNLIKDLVLERVKPVNALFAYDVSSGYSASEPGELGSCILTLTDEQISNVIQGPVLTQLRFLPKEDAYENQLTYWKNNLFNKLTLDKLHKICVHYHDLLEESGLLKTLV